MDGGRAVANRLGYTHLSLRVDDLGATLSELRSKGVSIGESTRSKSTDSNHEFAFITDPDGTRIELMGPIDPASPTMWDDLEG